MFLKSNRFDDSLIQQARTLPELQRSLSLPMLQALESAAYGLSEEQFWVRADCRQDLPKVRIPLMIVYAEDDPVVPAQAVPTKQQILDNPFLISVTTKYAHVLHLVMLVVVRANLVVLITGPVGTAVG
jgi:predicted alpha/beta-fold hydrolase